MKRCLYALWGLAILAFCSGCASSGGPGLEPMTIFKGSYKSPTSVPIEKIWPKTLAAMAELKLTVDRQLLDHIGGEIDARRVDGTVVKVRLTPAGEHSTTVGVRVGAFGNRDHAERIHDIIKKQLGV